MEPRLGRVGKHAHLDPGQKDGRPNGTDRNTLSQASRTFALVLGYADSRIYNEFQDLSSLLKLLPESLWTRFVTSWQDYFARKWERKL